MCNTPGELRIPIDFLSSQGVEGAAHAPVGGVGHEDQGAVDINPLPLAPLDGRLLVSVGGCPVLDVKTGVHCVPENLKNSAKKNYRFLKNLEQRRVALLHVHASEDFLKLLGKIL